MAADTDAVAIANRVQGPPPATRVTPLVLGRGRVPRVRASFPWALVAANALFLHLLTLPRALGKDGLLVGLLVLAPIDAAWARTRARSRDEASTGALLLWGTVCGLGGLGLLLAAGRLDAASLMLVPLYVGAVCATVAFLELGPSLGFGRAYRVALAAVAAIGLHIALGIAGGPSGGT